MTDYRERLIRASTTDELETKGERLTAAISLASGSAHLQRHLVKSLDLVNAELVRRYAGFA